MNVRVFAIKKCAPRCIHANWRQLQIDKRSKHYRENGNNQWKIYITAMLKEIFILNFTPYF